MNDLGGPTIIIKQRHHKGAEQFDQAKLHKSLVAACLEAGSPNGHADQLARRVVDSVILWLKDHPEVTSQDVRRAAARYLRIYHPDAAYLYEHHRKIL
ncbi:hypothetical protein B7Y94_00695 [Candidatus Saccharibacteria bacterium 32-49-12]|nr:MAG: hypothetical protein B7Y94_00695 [Candidatus Saccharibacteria bacterium 32-49-12]